MRSHWLDYSSRSGIQNGGSAENSASVKFRKASVIFEDYLVLKFSANCYRRHYDVIFKIFKRMNLLSPESQLRVAEDICTAVF